MTKLARLPIHPPINMSHSEIHDCWWCSEGVSPEFCEVGETLGQADELVPREGELLEIRAEGRVEQLRWGNRGAAAEHFYRERRGIRPSVAAHALESACNVMDSVSEMFSEPVGSCAMDMQSSAVQGVAVTSEPIGCTSVSPSVAAIPTPIEIPPPPPVDSDARSGGPP